MKSKYTLGINTGFAVNRFSEHEVWLDIVGKELGLKVVQFTADMLNVDLPEKILISQTNKILRSCNANDIAITSSFTGAFTRVNHLAHPDKDIRDHWVQWFKKFVDLSVDLGCVSMGSHFGIFTQKDNNNEEVRKRRRNQNIDCWHRIGEYALKKGLKYLTWEPMSVSREQGETIVEAKQLYNDINLNSPLPFKICLDVDHGDVSSILSDDTDPYCWIDQLGLVSPLIHLKQSSKNKSGHWPFIKEFNEIGTIKPKSILNSLEKCGNKEAELLFEFSFREREPADSTVIEVLKESVNFWRPFVQN